MVAIVSSRLDYLNKNPNAKTSFGEIAHELEHLKTRERLSAFIAGVSAALFLLGVASIIGGGYFVLGALGIIAGLGALYAYLAHEAGDSLRNKQVEWTGAPKGPLPSETELTRSRDLLGLWNWFSK